MSGTNFTSSHYNPMKRKEILPESEDETQHRTSAMANSKTIRFFILFLTLILLTFLLQCLTITERKK